MKAGLDRAAPFCVSIITRWAKSGSTSARTIRGPDGTNQIAAVLQGIRGTTEVKVEDVTGMPVVEIRIDKAEIARHGLSLSSVQDVIGVAVGGRPAGLVFEGDRRFQIVVRLADDERNNIEVLRNLPVPLPGSSAHAGEGAAAATLPLRVLADFNLSEGPNQVSRENGKRRVVVTADVRSSISNVQSRPIGGSGNSIWRSYMS